MPAGTAAGRLLRALAPVLRRFGDRWYLFGAQAAIVWEALDVVLGGPGPEEEFARGAKLVDIEGTSVPVLAPEELVVTKILAGRPKDIEDVRGILQAQDRSFDAARTRRLLRMLEEALDQSDLVPAFDAQVESLSRRLQRLRPERESEEE